MLTVQECRDILGVEAEGKTNDQIERLRDSIAALANTMYDQIQTEWKANPDRVLWNADAHQHGIDQ